MLRQTSTVGLSFMLILSACDQKKSAAPEEKAPAAAAPEQAAPADAKKKDSALNLAGDLPAPKHVAKPPEDAEKTESGIAHKLLKKGTGEEKPKAWDTVTVHYTGWTTDGKMFDSSRKRDRPATFSLSRVIPGWTQGLQLMTVGEERRLWIPEELAYKGRPGAPQGMLVFDVELISIKPGKKPLPAPGDVAAPPADAKKTAKGVSYKVLKPGTGKKPGAADRVKVHYSGWTTDGQMFDSSVQRGEPVEFGLNQVIPGWTDGLQQMKVGEKTRLWIPEALAYKGQPGRPPGMLVFDVELLEITKAPKPPETPKDVKAAPKSAKKTKSGLAYRVLTKGKGTAHPGPTSRVKVHYSGWTTDGKMFDSSVMRGSPAQFGLNQVIPGWTEGVQLMVEGEKTRFWIPSELAYAGKPGAPQGMLVFDVELLEIEK